jgi:hypothetical protein
MSPGGSMMSVKGLDISIYGHPRMSLALGVVSSNARYFLSLDGINGPLIRTQ